MSVIIHVALLGEGTDCWRPVAAEHVSDDLYRITGKPPDDTEVWEFTTGELVRCACKTLSGDFGVSNDCLVAYEKLPCV